jgi:hypothetical protein
MAPTLYPLGERGPSPSTRSGRMSCRRSLRATSPGIGRGLPKRSGTLLHRGRDVADLVVLLGAARVDRLVVGGHAEPWQGLETAIPPHLVAGLP